MDRWAKERTGSLALVMVVWESSGSNVWWAWFLSRGVAGEKVHKRPHACWVGEQDVAWTVACNLDCVYVFCVTYITILFTTHCWLRGEQKSRGKRRAERKVVQSCVYWKSNKPSIKIGHLFCIVHLFIKYLGWFSKSKQSIWLKLIRFKLDLLFLGHHFFPCVGLYVTLLDTLA